MGDLRARLSRAGDAPWKVANEWRCWWAYPRARLLFALNGIPWGSSWRFYGVPIIQKHRGSHMTFGSGLRLRSTMRSNPLGPHRPVMLATWQAGAVLAVGNDFGMTGGTICAAHEVVIGDRVIVGANTTIVDTDFHALDPESRLGGKDLAATAPVRIEDEAFIGMSCLVLKGVTIGRGCVVGAGSVVTSDLPPSWICAGNPARPIRSLESRL
jgi:serine acetyltransferase